MVFILFVLKSSLFLSPNNFIWYSAFILSNDWSFLFTFYVTVVILYAAVIFLWTNLCKFFIEKPFNTFMHFSLSSIPFSSIILFLSWRGPHMQHGDSPWTSTAAWKILLCSLLLFCGRNEHCGGRVGGRKLWGNKYALSPAAWDDCGPACFPLELQI